MQYYTVRQIADRFGYEPGTVHAMIRAGRLRSLTEGRTGPALIASADVQRVAFELRHAALQKNTELDLAHRTRAILWPTDTTIVRADGRPDPASMQHNLNRPRGREALRYVPAEAIAVFGHDVIKAAAAHVKPGVCRTCLARACSTVNETPAPRDTPAHRALLDSPCRDDHDAWQKQESDARHKLDEIKARTAAADRAGQQARFRAEFENAQRDLHRAQDRFATVQASAAPRTRTAAATPPAFPTKPCGHVRYMPCGCRTAAAHTCGQGTTVCSHCEAGR